MNNPLLNLNHPGSLPAFSAIKPEHVVPAIDSLLIENKKALIELGNAEEMSAETFLIRLEKINDTLSKAWSPVSHLNAVMNNDELREAYTVCLPKLSEYHTELGQDENLYKLAKRISKQYNGEDQAIRASLDKLLRNFKLSGVDLDAAKKKRFKELNSELSRLTSKFSDNVLDATDAWFKHILNGETLQGLPESALDMTLAAAQQRNLKGYVLTLAFPIFNAVMTYADDRKLRYEVYKAFTTRASEQGDNKSLDNASVMEQILLHRSERASLLGFQNYAEQSLYTKMAESPDQVMKFLQNLLEHTLPQAENEMAALKRFAKVELGMSKLQAWDTAYVAEKRRKKELDYIEEDVKPWFSVDKVVSGLFKLVSGLYNVEIRSKKGVDVWHEDVRFYEIYNSYNEHIASFYFDLYTRRNKRGGAWMDSFSGRYCHGEDKQIPVAYMTCNSTPPVGEKPALFTHSEVLTLFHEFGHGLHHMLTQVDYLDVSGINGVEWDAVELPSQFMENWCWERESLDMFARHYETAEKIPDDLFDKMIKTRHYNSAMAMLRQLEFALFDMRVHMNPEIKKSEQVAAELAEVRKKTSLIETPEFNRFQNSFTHIFAGGYAAGYYSYKWAEVLSADVFSLFEENGLFDQVTASSFLHEILEKGGVRPASESFVAFRGREPDISALLRYSGIESIAA